MDSSISSLLVMCVIIVVSLGCVKLVIRECGWIVDKSPASLRVPLDMLNQNVPIHLHLREFSTQPLDFSLLLFNGGQQFFQCFGHICMCLASIGCEFTICHCCQFLHGIGHLCEFNVSDESEAVVVVVVVGHVRYSVGR